MREAMDNGNVHSGNEFVRTPAPSSSSHSYPSPSPSPCASVASEKEGEGEVCGEGVSSSSRTDLKNSLLQLDQQRKEIEAEIAQLNELLNAEIGLSLSSPSALSSYYYNYPLCPLPTKGDIQSHRKINIAYK